MFISKFATANNAQKIKMKENKKKFIISLLSTFCGLLTLIAIFIGLNYDAINQSGFFYACWEAYFPANSTIISVNNHSKLIENINKELIYIFVLDVSISIGNDEYFSKPLWYDKTREAIENNIKIKKFLEKDTVLDIFHLGKLRITRLLLQSEDKNSNIEFAIWTVGNNAKQLYPKHGDSKLLHPDCISEAIEELYTNENIIKNKDEETNLLELFKCLNANYTKSSYNKQKYHLIMFSDLIHSRPKLKTYQCIKDDQHILDEEIERLANTNLFADIVILANFDFKKELLLHEYNIYDKLVQCFSREKIRTFTIEKSNNPLLLSKRIESENRINFYYYDPFSMKDPRFRIIIENAGNYHIETGWKRRML